MAKYAHATSGHLVSFANQGGSLGIDVALGAAATFAGQGDRRPTFGRSVEADEVAHAPSLGMAVRATETVVPKRVVTTT